MSQPIIAIPTRAPALRDTVGTDQADLGHDPAPPSRLWAIIEALAYAGAFIDPSGVLAVERLRRAREEQMREEERLASR